MSSAFLTGSGARLPELFNDKLPGDKSGWQSVGFVFEKGKHLPVGMSQRRYLGFDVVWLNCAFCHAGTVRETPQSEPKVYAAMPANTFDFRGFTRFLFATGEDRRFTPQDILRQIDIIRKREGLGKLPLVDRLVLRFYGIYYMRERLLTLRDRLEFIKQQPEWGPGRVDTFNPLKAYFNFPPDNFRRRKSSAPRIFRRYGTRASAENLKMNLHWDGNNVSLEERNRSAAMGTGITPPTGDRRSLKRVADWLRNLDAPPYPFKIDKELAGQGAPVYKKYCAGCHGADGKDFRGEYVGKVVPIAEIAPIAHRLDSYTYDVAVNQNLIFRRLRERALHPFPQNLRLRQHAARRPLVARALSAQRFGADAARSARAQRKRPKTFLSRLRRLRSKEGRLRLRCRRQNKASTIFFTIPTKRNTGQFQQRA